MQIKAGFGNQESVSVLFPIPEVYSFYNSCQCQVKAWDVLMLTNAEVQRGEVIGEGASGKVYDSRARGTVCAVKLFKLLNERSLSKAM